MKNVWRSLTNWISQIDYLPMDVIKDEPMDPVAQNGNRSIRKFAFAPNPALVGDREIPFLMDRPATKRTRSLPDEMTQTEFAVSQMEEHRANSEETQMIKGKFAELQQTAQNQQNRQREMEGAANALAKALDNVLNEVDLQTQRLNSLLAMHRKALSAVGGNPKFSMGKRRNCGSLLKELRKNHIKPRQPHIKDSSS